MRQFIKRDYKLHTLQLTFAHSGCISQYTNFQFAQEKQKLHYITAFNIHFENTTRIRKTHPPTHPHKVT